MCDPMKTPFEINQSIQYLPYLLMHPSEKV